MSIREEVQQLVQEIKDQGFTAVVDSTPVEAREVYKEKVAFTLRNATFREMHEVRDITIPSGDASINLRIYRPFETDEPLATSMFFHGGGFVLGDLDTGDHIARELAAGTRSVVVNVEYRVAPETPFPGAVNDAVAAIAWVWEHIDELGGDPKRLCLLGASAGGNLVTVASHLLQDSDVDIAAQVLLYATTDKSKRYPSSQGSKGYLHNQAAGDWFQSQYAPDVNDTRMSPMLIEDLSRMPRALIVVAELDPVRDEGMAYAVRLAEAGVDVWMRAVSGAVHGFLTYGNELPSLERERQHLWRLIREITDRGSDD